VLLTPLAERVIPDAIIRFDNALDGGLQTVYVFGFEHTQAQRLTIARTLVHRFAFPWYHVTDRSIRHFVHTFTADESVALGTWQATPFEVAGMLEHGFRGVSLSRDHLILSWNGKPVSPPRATAELGVSQHLLKALQDAVAATAPQAVLHDPHWTLAAKTGTTDGGRDA
jgi:membrane peptidoglycan carboxypeptidase